MIILAGFAPGSAATEESGSKRHHGRAFVKSCVVMGTKTIGRESFAKLSEVFKGERNVGIKNPVCESYRGVLVQFNRGKPVHMHGLRGKGLRRFLVETGVQGRQYEKGWK